MKQFQRVDIIFDFYYGTIERQRVVHDILQRILVHILSEEVAGYVIGYVLELHVLNVVEESLRQFLYTLWHVETTILGQSFHHCFLQVCDGSFPVCAIVIHIA